MWKAKYNPRSVSHKAAQVGITVLYCIISTACLSHGSLATGLPTVEV